MTAKIYYTGNIEIEDDSTGYFDLFNVGAGERCPDCGEWMAIVREMVDSRKLHEPYQQCMRCNHHTDSMPADEVDFTMSKLLENPNAFAQAFLRALIELEATVTINLKGSE